MRNPEFYAAVYAIIKNKAWEILFMKRQNTWFKDWCFQIPAGHLEWKESLKYGFIREMKEELWIDILEKDCEIQHISHRISKQDIWDDRVYFDSYIEVQKYSWEIKNTEPEKCSELKFIDINNISESDKELFWYDLEVIRKIKKWEKFSEIIME